MKKILIPFGILAIAISCSDDSIQVENSKILNFKNADEMFDYKSNPSIASKTFVSYDDVYHEALDKLSSAETEAEHTRLLEEYSDVVYLSEETYTPKLSNSLYRKIINRNRIYQSGDFFHKVIDDQYIITAAKDDLETLTKLTSSENLSNKFNVVKYQEGNYTPTDARTKGNCGQDLRKDYFYNQSNCRNDRRAWIRGYTWYAVSGYNYTPSMISEGWGELRTGTWCNWKQYATEIWTRNASYTVSATINGSTQDFFLQKPDYDANGDEYEHIIHQGPVATAIYWSGGAVPTIQFTQIHAECRTRGTNNNWAVLDCQ